VPVITASRNHYFYAAGMPSGLERWHGGDDLRFITFTAIIGSRQELDS
jgi:hypothetical protein